MSEPLNTKLHYDAKHNWDANMYKWVAITQNSGGQTVTVTSGQQYSEFLVPAGCFNLAQSYASFTATPTAAGAGVYNYLYRDNLAGVYRLEAFTRTSNQRLCDAMHVANMTKQTLKAEYKIEEFATMDASGVAPDWADLMAPSQSTEAMECKRPNNSVPVVPYNEPLYFSVGTDDEADPVRNFKIKLGDIRNTVFQHDKSFYFGEPVVIRITWNSNNAWGWTGTSATNPVTGAAAITGNIALSNLQLFMAQENNERIASALRSKTVSIPIHFPHVNKSNVQGTDETVMINISPDMGRTLKRVYHSVYPNSESLNARYEITNLAGAKFTSYFSMLNGDRLQPQDVIVANGEDWMINKPFIRDRVLGQKQGLFKYNFVHIDDFSGGCDDHNVMCGLDINKQHTYQFTARGCTSPFQYNHYTVVVCLKMLHMSPSGIRVD